MVSDRDLHTICWQRGWSSSRPQCKLRYSFVQKLSGNGPMALPRLIVFVLAALPLAGCCMSGSGCYVATEGPLSAWDGRGTPPDGVAPAPEQQSMAPQQPKTRMSQPKTDVTIGPITRARADATPRTEREWAEKEAADRDDDARLAKRLMICRDCMPSARDRNAAATGNMGADLTEGTSGTEDTPSGTEGTPGRKQTQRMQ
jgi:hypothetical protein